jgi:hypothetical protein
MVNIAYGHNIEADNDEYLELAQSAMDVIKDAGPLGNTTVDFFPSCMCSIRP